MRNRLMGVAIVSAFLLASGIAASAPALAASDCKSTLPSTLTHLGDARQVIVVTTSSWSDTTGRLRGYELRNGTDWCRVITPVKARVGWAGFAWAKNRMQSTGETPAGTFALPWAFGNSPDPGTALRYRTVDNNDWWAYDPKSPSTYNRWREHGLDGVRSGWAEHLASYGTQYAHSIVIDYNLPTATTNPDTRKGGGIFLHVNGPGATAGCVSVARADLVRVIRWLDPAKHPVIVMAPADALTRA